MKVHRVPFVVAAVLAILTQLPGAAAKDKSLLKQPDVLKYFVAEMKKMDAPKGVQDSLTEISTISAKKDIVDRDAEQVLKLIKRIQSVLG